jgi:transcriptional regulator with XRE-family HTH domain
LLLRTVLEDQEDLLTNTQGSFAEVAGVTQQYVSNLERALRDPTVVTLHHLASASGVSHVEFVTVDEARREAAKKRERRRSRRDRL